MENEFKYMVATRCITYAHASYIEDTLHGFVMQETTFPAVFLIMDDASTDGEPELLRHWAESNLIEEEGKSLWRQSPYGDVAEGKLRGKPYFTFVIILLSENHHRLHKAKKPYLSPWLNAAKYHAVCEGDDYWTNINKLQTQFDYMENHSDHILCFHSVYEKFENRPWLDRVRLYVEDRDYSAVEWYEKRPSQFASFFYRGWIDNNSYYKEIDCDKSFIAKDIPLLLTCARFGKIRGMSAVMSVYRHNETGWTQKKHSKDSIIKIAESELHYSLFGEEFRVIGENFYCLALVRAFVNTLVSREIPLDSEYLKLAWSKSPQKTVKAFFVLFRKYVKKYLKI